MFEFILSFVFLVHPSDDPSHFESEIRVEKLAGELDKPAKLGGVIIK